MKVLDPQSALLTNAEVYDFLRTNKSRPPDKTIGSYEPINLKDYRNVRQDFDRYIKLTSPHVASSAPPETWMEETIKRLRQFDLTKTEALTIINLGIGIDRSQLPIVDAVATSESEETQQVANDQVLSIEDEEQIQAPTSPTLIPADVAEVETSEAYHQYLLSRVVENIEERFPGEEGENKIQQILGILRECIPFEGGSEKSWIGGSRAGDIERMLSIIVNPSARILNSCRFEGRICHKRTHGKQQK